MPEFLIPEEILNNLNLAENMNACEFGCGTGFFTLALARRLKKGKVFGLDAQPEKLSVLSSKAVHLEGLKNVFTMQCDLENPFGSGIRRNYLDVVLIPNLLFQAENKCAIIKEGERILKPKGQLLIVDRPAEVLSLKQIKIMAAQSGLLFRREFFTDNYFGLLYTK